MTYKELWKLMDNDGRQEMKQLISDKLTDDLISLSRMIEDNKLSSTGAKLVLRELFKANPWYGWYLKGLL